MWLWFIVNSVVVFVFDMFGFYLFALYSLFIVVVVLSVALLTGDWDLFRLVAICAGLFVWVFVLVVGCVFDLVWV